MSTSNKKSTFAEYALQLDNDFALLEQLDGQMSRIQIESDDGLERAKVLLAKFGECGQRIGGGIQGVARSLEEARDRAEKSIQSVSERASRIQERQNESNLMLERLNALTELVRKVSATLAILKRPANEPLSEEERTLLVQRLPEFDSHLAILIEEAGKLRSDARSSNMKALERNADSLTQTLSSARRKLSATSAEFM